MNQFCTISTASHLYKVQALADSLKKQQHNFLLHVLLIDGHSDLTVDNCRFWELKDFKDNNFVSIINKYKKIADKLRWSLKPVFMKFLLEKQGLEKIIYLDNDQFFYSDFQFLFELLTAHSFLLTPHYYKSDPKSDQNWFEANFRVGLFNAGFVGANKNALKTLQWWAECCEYRCEKNTFRGLFDDQKYLDLIPVMDENAHIIRHQGCNVAGWNTEICKREVSDSRILINGKFPVVFIHFNDTTIREIVCGKDKILFNYYQEYVEVLKKYKSNLQEKDLLFPQPLLDKLKYRIWKILTEYGI